MIIVSDKEANQIFFSLDIPMIKKIPVVFCAVAVSDDRKQEGWENATGVVSKLVTRKFFYWDGDYFRKLVKYMLFRTVRNPEGCIKKWPKANWLNMSVYSR